MSPIARILGASLGLLAFSTGPVLQAQEIGRTYRQAADRLIEAALADSAAYARLTLLVDKFGHRFSGSTSLEQAIDWILQEMERDGLENVHGEPVMVPHWVRGDESVELLTPRYRRLAMLGLGGSIATPPQGITAPVLAVSSWEEMEARAEEARGKIVLYDPDWENYGVNVAYRSRGAIVAAQAGAVASLIRSAGSFSINSPHTGAMSYDPDIPKIPHAALTPEDARMLHRMLDRGERVTVRLKMEAQTLPDVPSRNVVAEIRGRERPEEIVVLGGHIDSWDVGQGAMDDGGGSVAAWEAVRLMHRLGMRPRRTVRVVLWTNEENGLRGGNAYRDQHVQELDRHVLAIESDGGVFQPAGFGFTGSDEAFEILRQVGSLLNRIDAGTITRGGGGADIGPIMREGVPGAGLQVDGSRYFWYHHSDGDTIDKLDPEGMARCVAAMAVLAYVVAELPAPLPR